MGVTDTMKDTASSVAGAGADLLIQAGHAAGEVLKAGWTAPPLKIPASLIDKKQKGTIEIPPAMVMMMVGALAVYGWLRHKGVKPFDWLWDSMSKVSPGLIGAGDAFLADETPAAGTVTDVGATIPTETAGVPTQYKAVLFIIKMTKKGPLVIPEVIKLKEYQGTDINAVTESARSHQINGVRADATPGALAKLGYSTDSGKTWAAVGDGNLFSVPVE